MVNFIRQENLEMGRNSERGHSCAVICCAHLCFHIHYFYAAVIKHHNLKKLIEKKEFIWLKKGYESTLQGKHGGWSRQLGVHIFNHRHKADMNWKWTEVLNGPTHCNALLKQGCIS